MCTLPSVNTQNKQFAATITNLLVWLFDQDWFVWFSVFEYNEKPAWNYNLFRFASIQLQMFPQFLVVVVVVVDIIMSDCIKSNTNSMRNSRVTTHGKTACKLKYILWINSKGVWRQTVKRFEFTSHCGRKSHRALINLR